MWQLSCSSMKVVLGYGDCSGPRSHQRGACQLERDHGHSCWGMFSLCLRTFFILQFVAENRKLGPVDTCHTCGLGMDATSVRAQHSLSKCEYPGLSLAAQHSF